MKMATNICGDDIKAAVFGLKIDKVQEKTELLDTFYLSERGTMDVSVLVKIELKNPSTDTLYLFIIKYNDEEYSCFPVVSIPLTPKEIQGKPKPQMLEYDKLPTDKYHITHNYRYNLLNVPLDGTGKYAFVIATEDHNPEKLLDAYYFHVEE